MVKAPFHCDRHDESLNGRYLIFRRPVDFSSRNSSRKECFAPFFAGRLIFRAEKVHGKSASHHFFFLFLSFFMEIRHQIVFLVIGEAKFLTTLSETSSEKRRVYCEPVASRELYLERHWTLGEGPILLL